LSVIGISQQFAVASRVYTLLESEDDDMSFRSKWKLLAQSSALGMVRYTVKARRTIFYAADEAIQDMSNEVTPEHLLLGLLRADESLRAHLVTPTIDSMRDALAANRPHERPSSLVFSHAAKCVIVFAAQEREHLSHKHTGTEHVLLGIIRVGSHAAKVLQQHGVTLDQVRQMLSDHKLVQWRSESFGLQSAR
jgi:ATP-dependent Clp protease ATP-binding subunit ClpA